jgi:2-phospho-L-lactate guanylyltransferase
MRVVVPFGADRPKTRLAPVLDATEREAFARAMLRDVLSALEAVDRLDREPTVLADAPVDVEAEVTVDDRPLTGAVNATLPAAPDDDPVAVVMADLPLVTADALEGLFASAGDVVLAPGRGGGTNALIARDPAFRADYHGASVRDHRRRAQSAGLDHSEVDSFRLATDVDEPADLVEVLLHAPPESASRAWLDAAGFELAATGGRARATRT